MDERTFVLEIKDGFTLSKAGTVDARLYKGGNRLYAKKTPSGGWVLKLEHGTVPPLLDQMFTRFDICEKFVRDFYAKRNIDVVKVID